MQFEGLMVQAPVLRAATQHNPELLQGIALEDRELMGQQRLGHPQFGGGLAIGAAVFLLLSTGHVGLDLWQCRWVLSSAMGEFMVVVVVVVVFLVGGVACLLACC
jgi:hypothetical protein